MVDGEIVNVGDPAARISFPYRPPLEYDYTVDFTLTSGSDPWHNIAQLASRGDVPFEFSTNAGTGHYSRLEDIDGHSVIGNPTLTRYTFVDGGRYTSVVRVRNDRVTCEINGEVLIDYETDYSDLSRNGKWTMPDQLNIGLGGYGGPTTFHSVTITPVPEPSTAALLSLGAVGLLVFRGRRRR
ncbi:MAG: PEP-CTERM sorting domain-containing protein [Candidatus Nealsonbacteria bacterium]|nr:PEP-CTERM sorting domain-containing protein [Candidatus Nealsonbacteria bacterium]